MSLTVNLTQLSGKRISIESSSHQIDLGAMSVWDCLSITRKLAAPKPACQPEGSIGTLTSLCSQLWVESN